MTTKKTIISLAILILGVFAGFFIFSGICKRDTIHHEVSAVSQCVCGKSNFLAAELKLTAEQREKLNILDIEFDTRLKAICKILCDKRVELAETLTMSETYNEKIDKCVDNIILYQAKIEKETAKHIFDVKKELTKEQKEKFIKLIHNKLCEGVK